MTAIADSLSHPIVQDLGWALVHFTWQATMRFASDRRNWRWPEQEAF